MNLTPQPTGFYAATGFSAGFSLIEVMVAILILGVALVGLTHGITTALGSSKESEQQTTAALLAAGRIETLRVEGDLTDGETDSDDDGGGPMAAYRWKQTISPTDIEGLHDVEVTVVSAATGGEIYALKTQLFAADSTTGNANGSGGKSKKKSE
jgi:general secretion pathway protein I